jgi:molybdate transport system permease protein
MSVGGRVPRRLVAGALPFLVFVGLPVAALLARASALEAGSIGRAAVVDAVVLSFVTAGACVVLAVVFGTPLAYVLGRARFPGRSAVDTLVDLPMVLPPSVAGVALLVAFGRRGVVGQFLAAAGIDIAFTTTAVVVAQLFVAAPYYVRAAAGAFARVERDLEDSAALDGASPWGVFRHVTAPLALPSLLAGAVMTWARALGEFGATIIFAGNYPGRTQTMPLAIYMGFELDLTVAIALSVVLLGISFAVLALVKGALRRGVFAE